ncbi:hypothetical protein [Gandjariella thermophila]|uniref:hypothetical protein n=1 Tax=Gandjariella thermophila TaxID=1931992 RepID=UPI0010F685D8|nr:hypothetical protein [Gandjariella thermophila]
MHRYLLYQPVVAEPPLDRAINASHQLVKPRLDRLPAKVRLGASPSAALGDRNVRRTITSGTRPDHERFSAPACAATAPWP